MCAAMNEYPYVQYQTSSAQANKLVRDVTRQLDELYVGPVEEGEIESKM